MWQLELESVLVLWWTLLAPFLSIVAHALVGICVASVSTSCSSSFCGKWNVAGQFYSFRFLSGWLQQSKSSFMLNLHSSPCLLLVPGCVWEGSYKVLSILQTSVVCMHLLALWFSQLWDCEESVCRRAESDYAMRQGKSRFGALDLGSEIVVLWKVHNSLRKFGNYCVLCLWVNFWALGLEDFYFFCSSISLFVSGNAVHFASIQAAFF